jgi:hypothetical protein
VLKELHHLLARTGQLRPPRFRIGILFKSSKLSTIDLEIDLGETTFGGSSYWIPCRSNLSGFGIFDERLPSHFDQRLFE